MHEVEESFAYTTFFALRIKLLFDNKNYIPLQKCFGVRKILEENTKLNNIVFKPIDEISSLKQFLEEFKDKVYLKDDILYLHDKVDIDEIDKIIEDLKVDYYLDYDLKTFMYLGINKPIKFVCNLCKFEKELEKLYNANSTNNNSIDLKLLNILIESKLAERTQILESLKIMSEENEEYINCIYDIINDILDKNDPYIIFPINKTLYENSSYYDEDWDIKEKFYDPVQVAIFSDALLYSYKIQFMLEKIYDEVEKQKEENEDQWFDETIDIDYEENTVYDYITGTLINELNIDNIESFGKCEDLSVKETMFAIKYLVEIRNFQEKYGFNSSLNKVINRIEYIIDSDDLCLDDENKDLYMTEQLENIDADYYWYRDEAYYFVYELFNIYYDEYFLKKLLFVKTYYDLTLDQELLLEISKYEFHPRYNEIYNIIISDGKNKTKHI